MHLGRFLIRKLFFEEKRVFFELLNFVEDAKVLLEEVNFLSELTTTYRLNRVGFNLFFCRFKLLKNLGLSSLQQVIFTLKLRLVCFM